MDKAKPESLLGKRKRKVPEKLFESAVGEELDIVVIGEAVEGIETVKQQRRSRKLPNTPYRVTLFAFPTRCPQTLPLTTSP